MGKEWILADILKHLLTKSIFGQILIIFQVIFVILIRKTYPHIKLKHLHNSKNIDIWVVGTLNQLILVPILKLNLKKKTK